MSGATLVGIIGPAGPEFGSLGALKIEQPRIEPSLCERQIKSNTDEHFNMFSRLAVCEQRQAAAEASIGHVDRRLQSMDTKLDRLLIQEATKQ